MDIITSAFVCVGFLMIAAVIYLGYFDCREPHNSLDDTEIDARLYALDPQLAIELGYEPPSAQRRGPVNGREIKGYASNATIPDSAPTGAYVDRDWLADFYARSA